MLQGLTQRVLDEQGSMGEDIAEIRKEIGRMSGRIYLIERRLSTVLSTIRTGTGTMADLQNQIDTLAERVQRLGGDPEVIASMYKSGVCAVRDMYKTPVCAMRKRYKTGVTRE